MRRVQTITPQQEIWNQAVVIDPTGPQFPMELANQAAKLEVRIPGIFECGGKEYCEFRLYDQTGRLMDVKKAFGY